MHKFDKVIIDTIKKRQKSLEKSMISNAQGTKAIGSNETKDVKI